MNDRRLLNQIACFGLIIALLMIPPNLSAQNPEINLPAGWAEDAPVLASLVEFTRSESDLRVAVIRYVEDKASIRLRNTIHCALTIATSSGL